MTNKSELSVFADSIMRQKYLRGDEDSWEDIAERVVTSVMEPYFPELVEPMTQAIVERKFMPGGRYLANAGQPFHQTQNCLLLTVEDNRESIADLYQRVTNGLMTGAGIGIVWSNLRPRGARVWGMGGASTGPCTFMQSVNEIGRGIMQGGSRRAAIWAGLHWNHPDVFEFMALKDWPEHIVKAKEDDFSAYAPLDMTNISIILDDDFFTAYDDKYHDMHEVAQLVYWTAVEKALTTGEPGFSIDIGENAGEHLRNACVAGDTEILTIDGYQRIADVAGSNIEVWNGQDWSKVEPKITGFDREMLKVTLDDGRSLRCTPNHTFYIQDGYPSKGGELITRRGDELRTGDMLERATYPIITDGDDVEWAYTQGFKSAEGMDDYGYFVVYNPKLPSLKRLDIRRASELSDGRGVRVSPRVTNVAKSFVPMTEWSLKSRLDWFAGLCDGDGTVPRDGGIQVASVDQGFLTDVQKMLTTMGVYAKVTKMRDAGVNLLPDGRGGERLFDTKAAYRLHVPLHAVNLLSDLGMRCERLDLSKRAERITQRFARVISIEPAGTEEIVYCFNEPERHRGVFDGILTGQCTEVTSSDDNDICNLGSVNISQVDTIEEFGDLVELGTAFLLCGTSYSKVPYEAVAETRSKNRRLGLGLMGIYEWLVARGYGYEENEELRGWLEVYRDRSDSAALQYSAVMGVSAPVKKRAIAPTGTIGILAETTTGIEPLFAVAYKRRYLKGTAWHYQYVIDATAKRLSEKYGVSPDDLETAYELASDPGRRLAFQAFVQEYVDHGISSTLNLPSVEEQTFNTREFGEMLMDTLPRLRGVTVYPDGARGGQPLNVVTYAEASQFEGLEFEEFGAENACVGGVCGI